MNSVKGKKLVAVIVAVAVFCTICVPATYLSRAASPAITMEQTIFAPGSEITVNYSGTSGLDWVAVYPRGVVPGTGMNSLVYQYTQSTGQPDGVMDFKNPDRGDITKLTSGDYDMYLLKNDGYEVLEKIPFTITESPTSEDPSVKTGKETYAAGEDMWLEYTGSVNYDAWIGIFGENAVPGKDPSSIWTYTRAFGQPAGRINLKDSTGLERYTSLTPGRYTAYLFERDDGGYAVAASFNFKINNGPISGAAPKSVQYTRSRTERGYADGTATVTPPDDTTGLTGYALYWGNDSGILEQYTPIKVTTSGKTAVSRKLNDNTLIPTGATKMYARAVYYDTESEESAVCNFPENSDFVKETPLYTFQVFSDTHIRATPGNEFNKNLSRALADILQNNPSSSCIVNVGDVSDNGELAQFRQYNEIINSFSNLPFIYCVPGNHDLRGDNGDWKKQIERFMQKTNAPDKYYAEKINGAMFIFLGSQTSEESNPLLSNIFEDQQNFLKQKLEEGSDGSKPIFVFHHQPLYNTVSGSLPDQGWNGIIQDAEIRAILKQYPQAVFFTGHTHCEFDSRQPMYAGNGSDATMFNTAAVSYLCDDTANNNLVGSQGLYLEVYKDKVLVLGRDFQQGKWISSAQFIVDTSLNINTLTAQISESENGLIARKNKIDTLLRDIGQLSPKKQATMQNSKIKLTALKTKIDLLEKEVSDLKASIENLPAPSTVSFNDKDEIEDAKTAFDGLTNEQKTLLGTAISDKLTNVLKALENLEPEPPTPNAPAAPTVSGIPTADSITLNSIDGAEYSNDGGNTWQDSSTFTGLTPNTEYVFVARVKATNTSHASAKSPASAPIKTAPLPANYTAVREAIAKIPTDLNLYTDESVKQLNIAKNSVVYGKHSTEQAIVDGYAKAIEDAVKDLVKKTASDTSSTPTTSNSSTTSNTPINSSQPESGTSKPTSIAVNPKTGDRGLGSVLWIALSVSLCGLVITTVLKKRSINMK